MLLIKGTIFFCILVNTLAITTPIVSPNDIGTPCNPFKRSSPRNVETTTTELPSFAPKENLFPVILVPGYSGTTLDYELSDVNSLPSYCEEVLGNQRERLWLSADFLDPFRTSKYVDCWYRTFTLNYSRVENTSIYSSAEGVYILPVEYMGSGPGGGTHGIDYIVEVETIGLVAYFGDLISSMNQIGYKAAQNLWGAGFDWRFSPDFLENQTSFEQDFENLIEKAYVTGGNKPIVFVAHSMGNLILTRFLNKKSPEWKSQYVKEYIAVSAPWTGTAKSIRDLLSGDTIIGNNWVNKYLDLFDRVRVLELAQVFGSITFMNPSYAMWGEFPFVYFEETQTNMTGNEIEEILNLCNRTDAASIYQLVKDMIPNLVPPEVNLTCLSGSEIPTERRYIYSNPQSVGSGYPNITYCGNGDGTVAIESLRLCDFWQEENMNGGFNIETKEYSQVDHVGILTNQDFIKDIITILQNL